MSGDADEENASRLGSPSGVAREPWMGALSLANLAMAVYIVLTSPADAIAAISPGCLTCIDSARIALREWAS